MMPHNWEYVAAAYGIGAIALLWYVLRLVRRGRAVSRALGRLEPARESPRSRNG
jgi:heme exporter protein CcmD